MLCPTALSRTYWVCAFCVNQHCSTCKRSQSGGRDPVTGQPYSSCPCGSPEYHNNTPPLREDGKSILRQMNKFDEMMAFLAAGDQEFTQVIAVDRTFKLFTRAWCVAELAEANKMGMRQQLKLASQQSLDQQQDQLRDLDVEKMQ